MMLHGRMGARAGGTHNALLARRERAEVLDRLWHGLAVEAHRDAAGRLTADLDVEEDLVGDLGPLGGGSGRHEGKEEKSRHGFER